MKSSPDTLGDSIGRWMLDVGCWAFLLSAGAVLATNASATTAGFNPYSGIVERNSFGLKPPVNPADLIKPPPPQAPDIKLQGITTILGRKQVLLKVRIPAKPPEPARDQSVVLSEGQREGEVEVLEINPADGTVKVNNAGIILPLNMKDHGEKPSPGAVMPAASVMPGAPGLPGVPPPPAPAGVPTAALPAAPNTAVETFGGNKTIPTRNLRTAVGTTTPAATGLPTSGGNVGSAEETLAAQQAVAIKRTPEENVILYEANRLRREASGNSFIKFPPHPALNGVQGTGTGK